MKYRWCVAAGLVGSLGVMGCESDPAPASAEPCDPAEGICTWAGDGFQGFDGDGNALLKSSFYWPIDLTFTEDGTAYVLDWNNHRVRQVQADGTLKTVVGNDFVGDGPLSAADNKSPGAPGTDITLNHPTQFLELPSGKMLLAAWHNHKLREWDPATGLGYVALGGPPAYAGDTGTAKKARVDQPTKVALRDDGSVYVLDMRNSVIRLIDMSGADPAVDSIDKGIVSTVAGTPKTYDYTGDGGSPLAATFNFFPFEQFSNPPPGGALALDADGRLYVSDTLNHVIRRIDFEADTIETVAGTGEAGFGGDGGPATEAKLNNPQDIEIGPDGRLYVADQNNHRVRVFDPDAGTIETIAGNGTPGFSGDGGPAAEAGLNGPSGIGFDAAGLLYVADQLNNRIRVLTVPEGN